MDPVSELARAEEAYQKGDLLEAQLILDQVVTTDPTNQQAWVLLSDVTQNVDQRISILETVLTLNPANAEARSRYEKLKQAAVPEKQPGKGKSRWIEFLNSAASLPILGINYLSKTIRDTQNGYKGGLKILLIVGFGLIYGIIYAFSEISDQARPLSLISQLVIGLIVVCFVYTGMSLAWLYFARAKGYDIGNREDSLKYDINLDFKLEEILGQSNTEPEPEEPGTPELKPDIKIRWKD